MKKVKVGIIGIGFMGKTHFDIYKENPKAEVVALADVDEVKLSGDWSKIIGNIGGNESPQRDLSGIKTYTNANDLIADPEVELVDICLPTHLHKEYVLNAFEKQKNIFVEKPAARRSEDCLEIIKMLDTNRKVHFMVGLCIRYWPAYAHAKKMFQEGKLGKLFSATFKRISPNIAGNSWQNWFMDSEISGGAILDLHIHDVDAVRNFFGKPKQINSFGASKFRSSGVDHVVSRFDYNDGSLVVCEGGWAANSNSEFEMSFQIIGDKATATLKADGSYKIYYENGEIETPEISPLTGWHEEIDHYLDNIINNKYDGEADRSWYDSIRMVEGCLESIQKKQTIEFEE